MPLALRAWLRYLVPLALLALIACGPLLWIALKWPAAQDALHGRILVRVPWVLACFAWVGQLWLTAAAAPMVRSIADGSPLSQIGALWWGLRGLVRGALPAAAAVVAILLGGLALAVPGLLLLVLLSLTGASDAIREPLPAPLLDSIAVARANTLRVAITLAAIIAAGFVVVFVLQYHYVPPFKAKITPSKLLPIRTFVRATGLALTALSPAAACVLAACYRSQRSR